MGEALITRRGGGGSFVTGTFKGDAAVNGVLSLPDVSGKKNIFLIQSKSGSYSLSNMRVVSVAVVDGVLVEWSYYSDSPGIFRDHKAVTYDGNGNFTLNKSYSFNFGDWSTVWNYYAY